MGHGLPSAVGYALSKKLKGEEGTIYCIMSDGEMAIGTTWEGALIAMHHKLDNLVVILDNNKFCAMGRISSILKIEPLKDKWINFLWNVTQIDGHNFESIEKSLFGDIEKFRKLSQVPQIIIASTVKGKGVSFMENNNDYHYRAPNKEHYEKALAELQ